MLSIPQKSIYATSEKMMKLFSGCLITAAKVIFFWFTYVISMFLIIFFLCTYVNSTGIAAKMGGAKTAVNRDDIAAALGLSEKEVRFDVIPVEFTYVNQQ